MSLKNSIGILAFLVLLFAGGCALPSSEREQQDFIPEEEIRVIEFVNEGLFYFKSGRYLEAEQRFRKARYLSADAANIQLNLALALEKLEQYTEAILILDNLIDRFPDTLKYRLARAHVLVSHEAYKRALSEYERIMTMALDVENMPVAASAARSMSVIYFQLGLEEPASCYSNMAATFEKSVTQQVRHARILLGTSQYSELMSFTNAEELIRSGSSSPDLLTQLALATFALGEIDKTRILCLRASQGTFTDPVLGSDLNLLQTVLEQLYPEEAAENEETEEQTEEDEEEQEQLLGLFAADHFENPSALYWPAPFLLAIETVKEKLYPEETESSSISEPSDSVSS